MVLGTVPVQVEQAVVTVPTTFIYSSWAIIDVIPSDFLPPASLIHACQHGQILNPCPRREAELLGIAHQLPVVCLSFLIGLSSSILCHTAVAMDLPKLRPGSGMFHTLHKPCALCQVCQADQHNPVVVPQVS